MITRFRYMAALAVFLMMVFGILVPDFRAERLSLQVRHTHMGAPLLNHIRDHADFASPAGNAPPERNLVMFR
jgi:hypothetical protein